MTFWGVSIIAQATQTTTGPLHSSGNALYPGRRAKRRRRRGNAWHRRSRGHKAKGLPSNEPGRMCNPDGTGPEHFSKDPHIRQDQAGRRHSRGKSHPHRRWKFPVPRPLAVQLLQLRMGSQA